MSATRSTRSAGLAGLLGRSGARGGALLLVLTAGASVPDESTASTPPAAAKSTPPDSADCIARARAAQAKTKDTDGKARAAVYAGLRDCVRALIDAGQEMNALSVARAAHEMFPSEPRAGFDYGSLLMLTKGEPAQARAVLEEALRQTPHLAPTTSRERALAIGNLGKLALGRGDAAAARDLLGQAVALDPAHADFLYDLAAADRKAADPKACLEHLQSALARDPSGATRDDYLLGAWALTTLDRPADAAAMLRKALERLPNASGLHLNLGYALARNGRPVDALLEYRYELLNGASDDPYALEARRQFQDGVSRGEATSQHAPAIAHLRGATMDDADDPRKVLAHVGALEQSYHHVTLDLLRAEALYATKDVEGSERLLRKSLSADPAFLPPYFDLSIILRAAGKDDEARRVVAEAVKRNPRHWQLTVVPSPQPSR